MLLKEQFYRKRRPSAIIFDPKSCLAGEIFLVMAVSLVRSAFRMINIRVFYIKWRRHAYRSMTIINMDVPWTVFNSRSSSGGFLRQGKYRSLTRGKQGDAFILSFGIIGADGKLWLRGERRVLAQSEK